MFRSKLFLLPLVTAALLAFAPVILAQASSRPVPGGYSISGQVRLAQGGTAVEFALVTLESFHGGVVAQVQTDRTGKFRFSGLGPAQYKVIVRQPGYKEAQREIDLQTVSSEYVQLQLVAEPNNGEVVVLPTKTLNAAIPAEAQKEYEAGRRDLFEEKNILTGILHLEKAVNLYPKYTEALLLLGTAYMDGQQWQRAETTLKKLLELDPKLATAHFTLGETYRRQKKFDEAEKILQEGLKQEPKSPQGHYNLGRVYFDKGDLPKAGPEIGQAIQLKPDFAEAYLVAGNLFMRARRAEQALPMFEEYLRLTPKGEFAPQTKELVEKIKKALSEKKP